MPFRGEYYFLRPERQHLVRGLIYPVPDPDLPFLGVHFTRTIDGRVEAGPNAVFAFAREGYNWKTVRLTELAETARYAGAWHMARRWWRTALDEYRRSFSPAIFAASLQQLVPDIRREDLVRGGAGVRAQAVRPDGSLADDFVIDQSPHAIHVLNAPSPAATASLAIGDHISRLAAESFGL
jgi:L-2-hydroxyglutarate oxidase